MNPFLRYLADKNSAHTQTDRQTHRQTDRQTDRHTPMITIPCGLRRAGKYWNRRRIQRCRGKATPIAVIQLSEDQHQTNLYRHWWCLSCREGRKPLTKLDETSDPLWQHPHIFVNVQNLDVSNVRSTKNLEVPGSRSLGIKILHDPVEHAPLHTCCLPNLVCLGKILPA